MHAFTKRVRVPKVEVIFVQMRARPAPQTDVTGCKNLRTFRHPVRDKHTSRPQSIGHHRGGFVRIARDEQHDALHAPPWRDPFTCVVAKVHNNAA